ncbi:hypothetical protein [Azospirillum sp.]|uniref:WD40/YVTN/BNR-like repeat-containing protein n=1 Tax=Azospirillum sp. TaxID=34012 RepID=UPI002623D4E1|nr:hypothetical protein [Azospirillum sp.]
MDRRVRRIAALGVTLVLATVMAKSSTVAAAPREADPLERSALLSPRAERAVLLGLARAGKRLVAVGERGVILYSDDNGANWGQAAVPVSVTLTAVLFIDPKRGWAAGHDGVLLSSEDGGATWKRQFDHRDVLGLYRQAADRLAKELGDADPRSRTARRLADELAADRRDRPWLDLAVDDRGRLWLAGAYGQLLRSDDGLRWEAWSSHLGTLDRHLYAVRTRGPEIVIVGEQGLVLRSGDGGDSFATLDLPYEGSLFTAQLGAAGITVAGLRGNVFHSADGGRSFDPLPLPAPVSVVASLPLLDGAILLADQAGGLYRLQGRDLEKSGVSAVGSPAAMVLADDGALVLGGSQGAVRLPGPLMASPSIESKRP